MLVSVPSAALASALEYLTGNNIRVSDLFLWALAHGSAQVTADLADRTEELMRALVSHPTTSGSAQDALCRLSRTYYSSAVLDLSSKAHGGHFSAVNMQAEQIQGFRVEDMASRMHACRPELWRLVFEMVSGVEGAGMDREDEDELDSVEGELWERLEGAKEAPVTRQELALIRTVVILSILVNGRNRNCNALQSVMGLFLHSVNAPEKTIKVLSHMGLSIACTSIYRGITSLSRQRESILQALASTRCFAVAYDNLDVKFRTLVSTVDSPGEGLVHLASATMLKLQHVESADELQCSALIWNRQDLRLNPYATDSRPFHPLRTMEHIVNLYREPVDTGRLSRRAEYSRWLFMESLCTHGPAAFRSYLKEFTRPSPVEAIPLTKLEHVPFPVMDVNPASIAGNLQALEKMAEIAGLGEDDRSDYVMLTHGDLGTFEHIQSARKQRSIERDPQSRLQHVEAVPGWFHFEMAAGDALWRMMVPASKKGVVKTLAAADPTSFFKYVAILRPNETGQILSKAKFRQQHELLNDVGDMLRLDAWLTELRKRYGPTYTLEEFAASKPSSSELKALATVLAKKYVAGMSADCDLYALRTWGAPEDRDEQNENTKLMLQYLALYRELSDSIRSGDIGRLESLLPAWINIFRATGKHKYANYMLLYMHNLYMVYPPGLRRVVRYNSLVNPTGQPGKWRAVDWVVELLNLYIKHIYSGEGSNFTKERMLLESALVLVFRSSHANFERNFRLPGLTTRHARKDMTESYQLLLKHMAAHKPNAACPGKDRKSKALLKNFIAEGAGILLRDAAKYHTAPLAELVTETEEGDLDVEITPEDISIDLDDLL